MGGASVVICKPMIVSNYQCCVSTSGLQNERGAYTDYSRYTCTYGSVFWSVQARPTVLARLFAQLELQKGILGVTSYGLTACSMEEVSGAYHVMITSC